MCFQELWNKNRNTLDPAGRNKASAIVQWTNTCRFLCCFFSPWRRTEGKTKAVNTCGGTGSLSELWRWKHPQTAKRPLFHSRCYFPLRSLLGRMANIKKKINVNWKIEWCRLGLSAKWLLRALVHQWFNSVLALQWRQLFLLWQKGLWPVAFTDLGRCRRRHLWAPSPRASCPTSKSNNLGR